jgi:hypothetical protein
MYIACLVSDFYQFLQDTAVIVFILGHIRFLQNTVEPLITDTLINEHLQ